MKERFNFIDIFSGAGGFSCGLEQAGMRCILGIDFDKNAAKTFERNHKHAKVFCGDITKLSNKKLNDLIEKQPVNLIVGGPPCQGFSTVGPGNPNDLRNKLFLEFVRIVKFTRPQYIVIENVTGLLAKKNEKTLKSILKRFQNLGYTMDVQVLSAHHYGVAEKRRRTIFIGSLVNEKIQFPKISHDIEVRGHYKPSITVGDIINDLADNKGDIHNHDLEASQIKSKIDLKRLKRIPEGKGIRYKKDEDAYLTKSLKLGVDWSTIREGRFRQTKYQRLDRQQVSPTIMTHRHSYYHPTQDRYLTQREAAKIQSFPNSFVFEGPLTAQWRQIGNAVPPLLAKAIGKAIKKMHREYLKNKEAHLNKNKVTKKNIDSVREKAFVYR